MSADIRIIDTKEYKFMEFISRKNSAPAIKPLPIEKLVALKLIQCPAEEQTTYEKFIGRKIKIK